MCSASIQHHPIIIPIYYMNVLELSEQEICRRNSLEELRKMGINPYPAAAYPVNA